MTKPAKPHRKKPSALGKHNWMRRNKNTTIMNNAQLQTADQTLKGAVIALVTYVAYKYGADMQLVALAIPVVSGLMAWISTKIGNKNTACLFVDKNDKAE